MEMKKSWWYDLQFLRWRVWQTEIGNFRSFFALKTQKKLKILKEWKNLLEISSFCQKSQSHDVWFLRYGVRQTESSVILGNFLPFYPLTDLKKQWTNGQADLRVTYRGGCPT